MSKNVIAINGSPSLEKGNTALMLDAFIRGLNRAGANTELFYTEKMDIKPCSCNRMYCWYTKPGECCLKDDMTDVYPVMFNSEILVLATPVYVPLPRGMQDFLNRIVPIILPELKWEGGRTRARTRDNVRIKQIVLITTGGWWEKENSDILVQIASELAYNCGVEFAGALVRPHAFLMKSKGELTVEGIKVLENAETAGFNLVKTGCIEQEYLDRISVPLIPERELRERYNKLV